MADRASEGAHERARAQTTCNERADERAAASGQQARANGARAAHERASGGKEPPLRPERAREQGHGIDCSGVGAHAARERGQPLHGMGGLRPGGASARHSAVCPTPLAWPLKPRASPIAIALRLGIVVLRTWFGSAFPQAQCSVYRFGSARSDVSPSPLFSPNLRF